MLAFAKPFTSLLGYCMKEASPEPSLTALVHLLAEQALLAMGVPHPLLQQQPPPNPAAARFYVDLVGVLKVKTEGQRTDAETRVIEEVLHELRMRVMNLESAPAPKVGL